MRPVDVELCDLVKAFGGVRAVDGIDLAIEQGEFLALLGPSGCGKTTTLRVIAGFEEPTSGKVLIGGESALGVPPHKRDVNTVFQQYALFPHLKVLENAAYGLKQRKVPKAERERLAREALELVRMGAYAHRRPAELSGGQQQRVALARALVMRPRVLLLDEPLGALDLKLRREMQFELKRIQEEVGITFVIVTHDQDEAMALADRIAVMHEGRIEQLAPPSVVYDAPATPFVAGFVGELERLYGTLEADGAVDCGAGVRVRPGRVVAEGRPGDQVAVGLRPEHVTARADPGADGEPAEVRTAMVLGHELQLLVRLRHGGDLIVRQSRDIAPDLERAAPHDAVRLSWSASAPMLLGPSSLPAGSPSPSAVSEPMHT